jgi:hypothetical protein
MPQDSRKPRRPASREAPVKTPSKSMFRLIFGHFFALLGDAAGGAMV